MSDNYEEFRTLCRAARAQEFSKPADRRAVRVALAASIAAGVQTAAVSASAAAIAATGASKAAAGASAVGTKGLVGLLLGGKFVSEIAIGVALGLAVTTTAVVAQRVNDRRATVTSGRLTAAVPTKARPNGLLPKETGKGELPQLSRTEVQHAPRAPRVAEAVSTRPPVVARGAVIVAPASDPPPIQDELVEETQALARVQDALSHRDPSLAWSLLQQQDRQFSFGQLGEERAAAKVMTLCATGQTDLADRARASFLMTYPNSPLTKRVKLGCDH